MTTLTLKYLKLVFFGVFLATSAFAAKVGDDAPEFSAKDSDAQTVNLSDYKGKYVVLEWHNQGCPYVEKHYDSGNMQKLQKKWIEKGVVWLSIISSAPGKQGFVTSEEEKAYLKKQKASPTAVIFDSDGKVGTLYGAKTTPHMFVIDKAGRLIYAGAIDDKPSTDQADIAGARNYVSAALDAAMAGKKIADPSTTPYGCSIKY